MMLIGDVRDQLSQETRQNVINLIERKKNKLRYYLLIIANKPIPGSNDIKTTLVMTSNLPYKMLGTICLYVDNVRGEIKKVWALPLDRPQVHYVDGKPSESIFLDAKGMPLCW